MVLEYLTSGAFLGFVIGIGVFLFWDIFQKKMYPISIPTMMQRGKSIVWDLNERAKVVTDKSGYEILKLKKRKHNIKPPKYDNVTIDSKGKPVYPLFNTTTGQYFPVELGNTPRFDVIEDKSSKNWGVLEQSRVRKTYMERESWFLKYAPYIMNATFAAMVIFFVIYFGGKMELAAGSLAGAADSLSNAVSTAFGNPPAAGGAVVP